MKAINYSDKKNMIDPVDLVKQQITDGHLWAKSFMDTLNAGHFTKDDIDESLMIAWFCNAIVTAQDKCYHEQTKKKENK